MWIFCEKRLVKLTDEPLPEQLTSLRRSRFNEWPLHSGCRATGWGLSQGWRPSESQPKTPSDLRYQPKLMLAYHDIDIEDGSLVEHTQIHCFLSRPPQI